MILPYQLLSMITMTGPTDMGSYPLSLEEDPQLVMAHHPAGELVIPTELPRMPVGHLFLFSEMDLSIHQATL